jgi:hypothetical protein
MALSRASELLVPSTGFSWGVTQEGLGIHPALMRLQWPENNRRPALLSWLARPRGLAKKKDALLAVRTQ